LILQRYLNAEIAESAEKSLQEVKRKNGSAGDRVCT
ncbi:unnamed protein product, partial [marine sediment metagenome]